MEITKESLEQQIETWINEKHQAVAKLNMLEGAIQSYRVLLSQIENGAVQDEAAPTKEEAKNGSKKNNRNPAQETNGQDRSKPDGNSSQVGSTIRGETEGEKQDEVEGEN